MSRGLPSLTALLGMLAVAGYQNRDKIGELLGGLGGGSPQSGGRPGSVPATQSGPLGGLFGSLASSLGGASAGSVLGGGLSELADRFRQSGHGETLDSWVGTGPNKAIEPTSLQQAIGPDVLDHLSKQTGLSHDELLSRLTRELPRAVDQYTPQGRLPSAADFDR